MIKDDQATVSEVIWGYGQSKQTELNYTKTADKIVQRVCEKCKKIIL
jgi:hypothetical protein